MGGSGSQKRKNSPVGSKIAVCAATEMELQPVITGLDPGDRQRITPFLCGIGPARAAYNCCNFFHNQGKPDLLLMIGIGGSLQESGLSPEDLVMAESECFADLGRCSETGFSFITIGKSGGKGIQVREDFTLSHAVDLVPYGLMRELNIKVAPFGTVSCVSDSFHRASAIRKAFEIDVENMEGAGAAMVCQDMGINFMEFRAISNIAGEKERSRWFVKEAINVLANRIPRLISAGL